MADVDVDETYETVNSEARTALNAKVAMKTIYHTWITFTSGRTMEQETGLLQFLLIHNSTYFLKVNEDMFPNSHIRELTIRMSSVYTLGSFLSPQVTLFQSDQNSC
jgi:hypothetical protein